VALLLCALLVVACGSGTSQTTRPTTPSYTTPTPLPSAGTVSATISGLGSPSNEPLADMEIAVDATAVWVYNPNSDGGLLRIDPTTNTLVATIDVGKNGCDDEGCGNVASGQGAVWIFVDATGTLSRIDQETNGIVATIPLLPNQASRVFVTPGGVWVTNPSANTVSRIGPQTNKVVATLTNQPEVIEVSCGSGSLWVCDFKAFPAGLTRLDPTTMQVQAQIDVTAKQGLGCYRVTALDQAIWVAASSDFAGRTILLERLDPATNQVRATVPVQRDVVIGFAADAQGVWALDVQGLLRVDPQSAQVIGSLAITGGAEIAGRGWFGVGYQRPQRHAPAHHARALSAIP
jgi:DNA-binding beta-propeller fold protein YncE